MVLSWLAQEGPHAAKHHDWAHPVAVVVCHYSILIVVTFWVHDWMVLMEDTSWSMTESCQAHRRKVGIFLVLYSAWFLPWRIYWSENWVRHALLYEYTWLCNGTLVLGSLASFSHRPMISLACCVTVGINQLLWYVDLLAYMAVGKFPLGVATYLTWPETTNAKRVTVTHHLWTIPVLMTTSGGDYPFPSSYMLSFLLMVLNVCLSRAMIPADIQIPLAVKGEVKMQTKYLNVNLSHELWKDIKFEWLQINYDNPPVFLYLFRLLWRWQGFNTIVFVTLWLLGRVFFAGDNHICKN
ncbi:expressed unknown protein [Seminavis robusta]|uniref:Uncharacterized protein n=1 Tax=Seminavis robusta TaxID=568900 RepID=A0A9N8DSZ9_9STRA|nr:expressed unknown protein [Seminavis robusta]|eukprot:Sro332_g119360.1 n/a (296) ;mRNA; r:49463-50350